MSTTFYIPSAPKVRQECEWCVKARREDWDDMVFLDGEWVEPSSLSDEEKARARCEKFCRGWTEESTAPEANFSESNAVSIIQLIGLEYDYGGAILHKDIPALMRRIMVLCATPEERAHLVREESVESSRQVLLDENLPRIQPGARMIDFGNTDEQTVGRLACLRDVLSAAAQNGWDVHWG